jgi:hypothetical protein
MVRIKHTTAVVNLVFVKKRFTPCSYAIATAVSLCLALGDKGKLLKMHEAKVIPNAPQIKLMLGVASGIGRICDVLEQIAR